MNKHQISTKSKHQKRRSEERLLGRILFMKLVFDHLFCEAVFA